LSAAAWILLAVAGLAAVADWVVVWRRPAHERAETVLKPLVLVVLIGVALAIDPADGVQRAWFVAALVLSLAGDVFLLPAVDRFVPGLASFLLAHVAYVVGFAVAGRERGLDLGVAALLAMAWVAVRVVNGVRRSEPALLVPVLVYISAIAAMYVAAVRHGDPVGASGAAAFVLSDSILALDRFDRHRRWMPLAVMVTYHAAQALLVLSLLP
jgi:uncharacterized membrane protein YhhN